MAFEWPIDRTGFPALPEDETSPEYARKALEQNSAAQLAVTVMHALSGRQFGLETKLVRPCRPDPRRGHDRLTSYVLSWEGQYWVDVTCHLGAGCAAPGPNAVDLPGPVYEVLEVKVNGVVVPPNVWVVEGNRLYRREVPWPPQNLNRPLGDPGTWGVTYRRGIPVPAGVDQLTGELAKQFIAAINDEGRCRLPSTVTTVRRQGVTYRAYDPAVIYANGKTGLREIDLWLATVNPNHLMAAPSVI